MGRGLKQNMNHQKYVKGQWQRRKNRVRKKVIGTAQQPRMTVFRSLRNVYVQVIDDINAVTLVSASTKAKDYAGDAKKTGNKDAAGKVGEDVARKALAMGIRQVRFDRNGYQYHGRVKALAEAARKAGLVF